MSKRSPLRLQVSAQHIRLGKRANPNDCPVALALTDAGYKLPCVSYPFFYGYAANGMPQHFDYDEGVRQFVTAFDDGADVEPCILLLTFNDRGVYDAASYININRE